MSDKAGQGKCHKSCAISEFFIKQPQKTLIHPLDVFVFALKSPRYFVEIHAVKE
jgi:hypothetical protein